MTKSHFGVLALLLTVAVGASACGGDDGSDGDPVAPGSPSAFVPGASDPANFTSEQRQAGGGGVARAAGAPQVRGFEESYEASRGEFRIRGPRSLSEARTPGRGCPHAFGVPLFFNEAEVPGAVRYRVTGKVKAAERSDPAGYSAPEGCTPVRWSGEAYWQGNTRVWEDRIYGRPTPGAVTAGWLPRHLEYDVYWEIQVQALDASGNVIRTSDSIYVEIPQADRPDLRSRPDSTVTPSPPPPSSSPAEAKDTRGAVDAITGLEIRRSGSPTASHTWHSVHFWWEDSGFDGGYRTRMTSPRITEWSGNLPTVRQRGINVVPKTHQGDVTVQVQGRASGESWDSTLSPETTTSVTLRGGESGAVWVDDGSYGWLPPSRYER